MRYEMKRKEDARVVRTRQKLFTSFKELLGEKTFEHEQNMVPVDLPQIGHLQTQLSHGE